MDLIIKIISRWYIILAFLLVYKGTIKLIESFKMEENIFIKSAQKNSLQKIIRSLENEISIDSTLAPQKKFSVEGDPFNVGTLRKPSSKKFTKRQKKAPPPLRNFVVKGITNSQTAIIESNQGESFVVEPGDVIDSAEVLEIFESSLKMKDREGTFILKMN